MSSSEIIGREYEIEKINNCLESNHSQLIVIYGRRRIGKTFLVNRIFDGRFAFKVTGAYNKSKDFQIQTFKDEFYRKGVKNENIKNWHDVFFQLREYIESLDSTEKQIVFFDEMPWMETNKSDFFDYFELFWNDFGCAKSNLILIVCGSSSSWICNRFFDNKGGLFNRHSLRLFLEPFNLCETELFLKSKNIFWSRYDILQCFFATGGVPYYLDLLDKNESLSENIDNLFFRKRGLLWDEFDTLYGMLFKNEEIYKMLVETLSKKIYGMTRIEIAKETKLSENGFLTKKLTDLINSGLVIKRTRNGVKKETVYILNDYYTLFYFKFIKNHCGIDENFWKNSYNDRSRSTWCGMAFEKVCFDHINQIKNALGILGIISEEYSFYYNDGEQGAQIDMVIERKDKTLTVCEIKFCSDAYLIDKDYDANIRNKLGVFERFTEGKKTLQFVMITTYPIKKGMYSSIVNKNVTVDDLFAPKKQ